MNTSSPLTLHTPRRAVLHTAPARLSLLAMAALMAACGGGDDDPVDPLQSYRSQTLQWKACTAEVLGKEIVSEATQAAYGTRLQCVQMRAPMDWSNPDKGDIQVAMMRVASADPAQRKASLLFNPGGPGQDGLTLAISQDRVYAQGKADHPLGRKFLQLRAQYDLVGFSPRGLGSSTLLECPVPSGEAAHKTTPPLSADTVERAIEEAHEGATAVPAACKATALAPFVNSDATARDMDLMRHLLGDEKLHYFGYSYGTWLGAWYAGLYPEKVGRMVMDSVQDFTSNHEDSTRVMAPAREKIHQEVLLPYFTRHAPTYGMNTGSRSLQQQVSALDEPLRRAMGSELAGLTYGASNLDKYGETLAAAIGLQPILNLLPETASAEDLAAALAAHTFVAGDPARDARIRKLALELAANLDDDDEDDEDDKQKTRATAQAEPRFLPTSASVFFAVGCNDAPTLMDLSAWRTAMRADASASPLFFNALPHCIGWGAPSVTKPALTQLQSVNALIVQSQYDGATPAEGSARTFAQMPASKQVYVQGEYVHALFPYAVKDSDDQCTDHAVLDYLLGSDAAPRSTTCAARPLELDRDATKSAPAHGSAFRDPQQARELVDALHSTIGRPR